MSDSDPNLDGVDPFARLKRQAAERSDRTVERISAGIAALRAGGKKITVETLKEATRELEPGFAGLSFQVIRRNPRAYALYREAADPSACQLWMTTSRAPNGAVDGVLEAPPAEAPARPTTRSSASTRRNSYSGFDQWSWNWTPSVRDAPHSPTTSRRCSRR